MFKPENEIEQLALDFFVALGSGDFVKTRQAFHPDISWRVMGRGVPGAGTHRGADAIFGVIGPVRQFFAPGSPQMDSIIVTSKDQRVVVESHGGGFLKDGRIYDNYYVMVLQFKGRLLHELREYMDTYYVNSLKLSE